METNNLFNRPVNNFDKLEKSFEKDSSLSSKVKALICVATANKFRNRNILRMYMTQARDSGASEEDIVEAVTISALETSGTQLFWLKDVFDTTLSTEGGKPYHISRDNDHGGKWVNFQESIYEESSLDRKTKELITVTQASFGRCPHCTKTHLSAARQHGCSKEEITEALILSATVAARCDLNWFESES